MCGIIGCVARDKDVVPVLVEGLRRVEYRGYDSAGIAVVGGGDLSVRRVKGKMDGLVALLERSPVSGQTGIAHTRWATHGEPSEVNAHPQTDASGRLAVVHNGIVENYRSLRRSLEADGHVFTSETDTEVLAHLIGTYYQGNLEAAVRAALLKVRGAYGMAVIHADEPGVLVQGLADHFQQLLSIALHLAQKRFKLHRSNGEHTLLAYDPLNTKIHYACLLVTIGARPIISGLFL